jgi:hypothetical protein
MVRYWCFAGFEHMELEFARPILLHVDLVIFDSKERHDVSVPTSKLRVSVREAKTACILGDLKKVPEAKTAQERPLR